MISAAGDLDGDNDGDLVVGREDGALVLRNEVVYSVVLDRSQVLAGWGLDYATTYAGESLQLHGNGAEANATISLYVGDKLLTEVQADAQGDWSYAWTGKETGFAIVAGKHYSVTVQQTDVAGNTSIASLPYVIDVYALPAVSAIALSADNGSSDSDFLTNAASQTISATLNRALLPVEVLYGSVDGGQNWINVMDKVNGTAVTWDQLELKASGSITFKVLNGLGTLAQPSQAYTIDTLAPVMPNAVLTAVSSSGVITAPTNTETGAQVEYRIKSPGADKFGDWSETYKAPLTDGSADGAYQVEVRQTDAAGNVSTSQSLNFTLDSQAATPDAKLTTDSGSSTLDGITQSGALTAPTNTEPGALVEYRVKAPGADKFGDWSDSYTAPKTDSSADGVYAVEVRQTDKAGNVSASQALNFTLDTIVPTIAISSNKASLGEGETATITFTLSESSKDFSAGDIAVSGGTLSGFSGSGTSYSVTFTPTANSTAAGSIGVANARFSDAAGNFNADGGDSNNSVSITVDTVLPTVAISSDKSRVTEGQTATITFTLSESSSDFSAGDITVSGGTLSGFSGSGTSYSATFTPTAGLTTPATLSVASDKFSDAAGNFNTDGADSNNSLTIKLGNALPGPIELSDIAAGSGGFVINGQSAFDESGHSVSGAGDVNGDGLADLIVGAYRSSTAAGDTAGRSYVVFGRSDTAGAVDLSAVAAGSGGFMINGQCAQDRSGWSVSSAGDVNGDGLADLIIGADLADPNNILSAGRSYVVFGHSGTAAVELSAIEAGNGGFVINGQDFNDASGFSVSGAGDVNGDGLTDLIVGALNANPNSVTAAGRSYVVLGRSGTAAVELSAIAAGNGGFAINGQFMGDYSGISISGAGDVNGDGLADLFVGAQNSTGHGYVVFGRTGTAPLSLSAVAAGTGGFVVHDQATGGEGGFSVSGAGDVNGDGLADLILGVSYSASAAGFNAGRSYVVFGQTAGTPLNMSAVAEGSGGFVINGQSAFDQSGYSVSGAGDVNGDGLSDLIVGAPGGKDGAGQSYVVYGRTGGVPVELSAIAAGSGGFAINGMSSGDYGGHSVSGAGDVNGDGLADLIVGSPLSDPSAGINAGRSYVIFGATDGAFSQTAVDQLGSSGADTLTDGGVAKTLVAGAGDDALSATAASVLYGGAGNDSFSINGAMITALQSPFGSGGNAGQLARIDGGSGLDRLVLLGSGLTLDLTKIANPSGGNLEMGSRLVSLERIDLGGAGNQLLLSAADIRDLADVDSYNSGKGWTGLEATVPTHQLLIDGASGDTLSASGPWVELASVSHAGQTYRRLVQGSAELLVDADITLDVKPVAQVKGIAFSSATGAQNGLLNTGDTLLVEVTFSEAVTVSGGLAPQITLNVGGNLVQANCTSGAVTSDKLVFKYFVAAGQTDLDGISISANAINLQGNPAMPGATIRDASGNDVLLSHGVVAANASYQVDSVAPATPDAALTAADDDGGAIAAPTNVETGATLEYRLSKGGTNVTSTNDGWSSSYTPPATDGSADGNYLLELRQTDRAGNVSSSQSLKFGIGVPPYAPVELSAIAAGSGGFVINGRCKYDQTGWSVSGGVPVTSTVTAWLT